MCGNRDPALFSTKIKSLILEKNSKIFAATKVIYAQKYN